VPNADYLTPAQLVTRWNEAVTIGTLSNWRSQGRGPTFVKIGRSIRYPLAAVVDYEAGNTHDNDNSAASAAGAA
jgi:hypothetical protein